MLRILIIFAVTAGGCGQSSWAEQSAGDANSVKAILDALSRKTSELKSYQCSIEYQFSQPILESKTLRTGNLYYARLESGSRLRIEFDTLVQDDGPKQDYKECYIFDGQWLTHIDYQIKQVQKRQLAEANEPVDAFELAKRNFPIIGFSKSDDLKKQFEITLKEQTQPVIPAQAGIQELIHLHLKVRPDSQYKDDYKSVDVWVDTAKTGLPEKITATNINGDIYEIGFIEPKVNQPVDEKVFEFTIPDGFGVETTPIKENKKTDRESTRSSDPG
jgi:outer membrane lipoprotein-sorting protein